MFKQILISTFFIFLISPFYAQKNINTNNIEIIRDEYGVPHIFTKTDVEAVYGIAWAQCEDNFHLIQDNLATAKNMAGRLMGKNGAALDFLYQVFEIDDFVERRYEQDITPKIEKMLVAYADALNQYAATHPDEVKSKKLFPVTPKKNIGKSHTAPFISTRLCDATRKIADQRLRLCPHGASRTWLQCDGI